MRYLIVVAHPDDDILGCGGLLTNLTDQDSVKVCFMCGMVTARSNRESDNVLINHIRQSLELVNIKDFVLGDFVNLEFNNVPHIKLVQFIEKSILDFNPDIVITHHPNDLNNDHVQTSLACNAAVRLFQRHKNMYEIKEFLYMEIPSSTDWTSNSAMTYFKPNLFVDIGEKGINNKIEALKIYQSVIKDYPHSRSEDAIKGLALYRGGQAKYKYAEAFESVYRRGI